MKIVKITFVYSYPKWWQRWKVLGITPIRPIIHIHSEFNFRGQFTLYPQYKTDYTMAHRLRQAI